MYLESSFTGHLYTHGPKFSREQREFILQEYEGMKTLPQIVADFRETFPNRGVSVTENSLQSFIGRMRKLGKIKRPPYSRSVRIDIKMVCVELYNKGFSQNKIIKGIKERFPEFERDINRNMISGWVKWGKDHKLLNRTRQAEKAGNRMRKSTSRTARSAQASDIALPVTLPYVHCLDPQRAAHMAQLLRMPVEIWKLRNRRP